MADARISRRHALLAAGAAGATVAALKAPAAVLADSTPSGVQGTWLTTVTLKGGPQGAAPPPFISSVGFAAGGVLTSVDTNSGSTGVGSWESSGRNGVDFVFVPGGPPGGSPPPGPPPKNPLFYVTVNGQAHIDDGKLLGSFRVIGHDGSKTMQLDSGTLSGRRLTP